MAGKKQEEAEGRQGKGEDSEKKITPNVLT